MSSNFHIPRSQNFRISIRWQMHLGRYASGMCRSPRSRIAFSRLHRRVTFTGTFSFLHGDDRRFWIRRPVGKWILTYLTSSNQQIAATNRYNRRLSTLGTFQNLESSRWHVRAVFNMSTLVWEKPERKTFDRKSKVCIFCVRT